MAKVKNGNVFYGDENYVKKVDKHIAGDDPDFIPIVGARSSVPDNINTFAPNNKLVRIEPDFPVEWLDTMQNLAAYNPDISYAIDNIIQLANTEHDIYFSDKVKDSEQKKMKAHLKEVEGNWYQNSGGIRSLKADLLVQIAVNGALSGEIIPNEKLKGVKQVVKVDVKNIRFVYEREMDLYMPYQVAYKSGQINDMVELNPRTYHYIALRRYFQTPYATPPFIAAIESLCIQKDMLSNFKNIMQKLGMLGFLSAEVTPPAQLPGETQPDYFNRCNRYLTDVVYPQLQKNLGKGMVAGFKGRHEFKLEGNNMNVQGAEGLFKLVQSRIFAGVKQDPNMLGENYSTTETMGRVILIKMLSQVRDYQQTVDSFFERLYLMELQLAGFAPGYVQVVSKKPIISDQVKEQEARSKEIANVKTLRDMGILGQQDAAEELGYDEPFSEGDVGTSDPLPKAGKKGPSNPPKAAASNKRIKTKQIEFRLHKVVPEFDYCSHLKCGNMATRESFIETSDFKDAKIEGFIKGYFNAMNKQYKLATSAISKTVATKLLNFSENAPLESIQREVYLIVITKWESEFVVPMQDIVEEHISKAYDFYRKDKSIFPKKTTSQNSKAFANEDLPEAVLDLDDYRAITYMEQSDTMYLGKFITDKDTKKAVYKYIEEEYLNGYLPIGNNDKALNKFSDNFAKELNLEAWKIRRIIDTTVNKIRNYAHVNYLSQASIETFEIIEWNDNLTCDYCAAMDGKKFSVTTAKEKVKKVTNSSPSDVSTISPFITSKDLQDIQAMNESDLQAAGFDTPPFHPHCRGTISASFS